MYELVIPGSHKLFNLSTPCLTKLPHGPKAHASNADPQYTVKIVHFASSNRKVYLGWLTSDCKLVKEHTARVDKFNPISVFSKNFLSMSRLRLSIKSAIITNKITKTCTEWKTWKGSFVLRMFRSPCGDMKIVDSLAIFFTTVKDFMKQHGWAVSCHVIFLRGNFKLRC